MQWQRLTPWIIVTIVVCAALGGWAGANIGGGSVGNIALISATCAVLGSFLPGGVLWIRDRVRDRGRPHQDAA